ncbi:MAG: hypothetical protein ABW360_10010 [Phenylobacterium sp.]
MPDYRLYFLGPQGRIAHVLELECRDDDHAVELAAGHADGRAMELWRRDRMVKAFDAGAGGKA